MAPASILVYLYYCPAPLKYIKVQPDKYNNNNPKRVIVHPNMHIVIIIKIHNIIIRRRIIILLILFSNIYAGNESADAAS